MSLEPLMTYAERISTDTSQTLTALCIPNKTFNQNVFAFLCVNYFLIHRYVAVKSNIYTTSANAHQRLTCLPVSIVCTNKSYVLRKCILSIYYYKCT